MSLLRSDKLPYPDQSPAPRAEMLFGFFNPMYSLNSDSTWCTPLDPVIITDTAMFGGGVACWRIDSIFFESFGGTNVAPSYINFGLRKWTGYYFYSVDETKRNLIDYTLYPNPSDELLNVDLPSSLIFSYTINTIYGQEIVRSERLHTQQFQIITNKFPAGVYYLKIISTQPDDNFKTKMIVITH